MSETVHIIPVGFDYERLLHPISKGDLNADRVRLLGGDRSDAESSVIDFTDNMIDKLSYTFREHLEIDVEVSDIDDIDNYRYVFQKSYRMLREELNDGNSVWINISSMPRTVAFAFAAAANSYVVENPEERERLHTYYVRPEKYYAPEMFHQLLKVIDVLSDRIDQTDNEINELLKKTESLVESVSRSGITKGAKRMEDGELYIEFPASPHPNLRDFEIQLLKYLAEEGPTQSTSELARQFGRKRGLDTDSDEFESFRSKVQYNVDKLENKGYVKRRKSNNRLATSLSLIGELWVETHTDINVMQQQPGRIEA